MRDDTLTDSSDIKFACSQCGQRIVVEKSGAGLTANCPICDSAVTVPQISSIHDHSAGSRDDLEDHERSSYADPGLDETREELFSSVGRQGEMQREIDAAQREIERLRSLFKKTVDECERVTASATHAQAEIKSFQTDRQQLKSDLSQTKQRALAAENQVAELAAALAAVNQENTSFRQQIEHDFTTHRELLSAAEIQLAERERELAGVQAENSEVVQSLADAQSELAAARNDLDGLRGELTTARQQLDEAAEMAARADTAAQELRTSLETSQAAEQRLKQEQDQLRNEIAILRHDLAETDSGQDLLQLRSRIGSLEADLSRTALALAEKITEAQSLAETKQQLRAEVQETRQLLDDAERRAAVNSEAQLKKDNDVLRGIVARQNTTLGVYYVEVRRMRRARFGLRIVYALFALGLLALVFLALIVFAPHGLGGVFGYLHL